MGARADIHYLEKVFDRTSGRYLSKFYPEDREDIERFINDLTAQEYSTGRVNKYLASLVSIKKRLGVPFREATTEDVKRFAAWLERSNYTAWYKHDLKVILRKYMRWLGRDEAVSWMKITQPKNGTLPEEILREEEIKRMAEAAITTRDKAFVLALYESGARIGSFCP